MRDSLFAIFCEVHRRQKDVLLYISAVMYAHLVPIVGAASQVILFQTSPRHSKTLYWWSYRHGRRLPSQRALSEFLAVVQFKEKLRRCPKWTATQDADFLARRRQRQSIKTIAAESTAIRDPLIELGYTDTEIYTVVFNRAHTENKKKRGREE